MASKTEIHYCKTQDGWKIALHHHPGRRRKNPVLLVHGLASNFYNMDFPVRNFSLARFLNRRGFDVWIVDLRGSGMSQKSYFSRWYFDDYVFQDLPAAVEKILELTGARRIHWVGHSLGGLLAYPFAQTFHRKKILKSLVTVAAPVTTNSRPGYFKHTYRVDSLLRILPIVPYRTISRITKVFADFVMGMDEHFLWSKDNMNREILTHMLEYAVESVPSSVILQIHDWLRNNHFMSRDGKINYLANLHEITAPILMIAGTADTFTTPADLRLAFRKIPNAKRKQLLIFGKSKGHKSDYGHIDLLLGKNAPKEVYPQILKWLETHDR